MKSLTRTIKWETNWVLFVTQKNIIFYNDEPLLHFYLNRLIVLVLYSNTKQKAVIRRQKTKTLQVYYERNYFQQI